MSKEVEEKQEGTKLTSKVISGEENIIIEKKKTVRKKTKGYPKNLRLSSIMVANSSIRLPCRTKPNINSSIKRYIGGGINVLNTSHTFTFMAEMTNVNGDRWGQLEEDNTWVRLAYFTDT